ncbi:copper resistance protein CopC [Arthrobacter rhombi]
MPVARHHDGPPAPLKATPMNHHTPTTRLGAVLAAVLLALLVPIGAASAHDTLVSTDPASGSTVQKMPQKIGLTYDNIPIALGSEIRIIDAEGTNWAQGQAKVTNRVVNQGVQPGTPAGTYTVQWRVVSSDGHPIQGNFTFTTRTGAAPGAATPSTEGSAPAQHQQDAPGLPPWIIPVGVAVLILIGAGAAIAWRRLGTD